MCDRRTVWSLNHVTLRSLWLFTALIALTPSQGLSETTKAAAPSDGPIIEVVVVGPGSNFYTIFGHLAVLIRPSAQTAPKDGQLYNFGVTKFSDPGYLWAFMTGQAVFWGNKRPYRKQLKKWRREDRTVTRFPLLLDTATRRKIHQRFQDMISLEKREFRYDTFRENCSTKVRDVLDEFSDGALSEAWKGQSSHQSFRDRARYGYSKHIPLLVLLEWGAGEEMDAPRTAWQRSGEPAFFGQALPKLRTKSGQALFGKGVVDRVRKGPPSTGASTVWLTWVHGIIALLLVIIGVRWTGPPTAAKGAAVAAWALGCAAFGALACSLHLISLWPETRSNWLMLGANPLDIILLITAIRWMRGSPMVPSWVTGYLRFRVCLVFVGVCVEPLVSPEMGPIGPRLVFLGGWFMVNRMIDDGRIASERAPREPDPSYS